MTYAEQGSVYSLGRCFSRCIQGIGRAAEVIEDDLRARLGLYRQQDKADVLIQQLDEIERSLQISRQEWSRIQTWLRVGVPGVPVPINIRKIIDGLSRRLGACLESKNAILDVNHGEITEIASVLNFNEAVQDVLSEMILGGIADRPDQHGERVKLRLSTDVQTDWVVITLHDDLTQLSSEDAARIEENAGSNTGVRFTRAWGLLVMQQVAVRGGGRLSIAKSGGGNTITYRVPRARNG
jgi:hypothetical protein